MNKKISAFPIALVALLSLAATDVRAADRAFSGVVRERGGSGLAGATVVVREGTQRAGAAAVTVTTDAKGSFRAAGLPAGPLDLEVSKRGYRTVRKLTGKEGTADLALDRAPRVAGRAVDESGAPLAPKVVISYRAVTGVRSESRGENSGQGRFEVFLDVPAEEIRAVKAVLSLRAEGYVEKTIPLDPASKDMELGDVKLFRGRTLRGQVRNAVTGNPVAGASVLWARSGRQTFSATTDAERTVTTKDDGTFAIPGVPEGEPVRLRARGPRLAGKTIEVDGAANDVDLTLTGGGKLLVRFCGAGGGSLGVNPELGLDGQTVAVDAEGKAVVETLEAGTYGLTRSFDSGADAHFIRLGEIASVEDGRTTEISFGCTGPEVQGMLKVDGAVKGSAMGALLNSDETRSVPVRVGPDGRFSVRVPFAGPYVASFTTAGMDVPPRTRLLRSSAPCQIPEAGGPCVVELRVRSLFEQPGKPEKAGAADGQVRVR
ncbi:MAG: carboxypeptidase regulatory-like domain-containing protein [Acidobacteria bacterium]|nr:carboxypeptidase regulatory-like domain-containing protein [Acidobacteriota bacterium]